MSKGSVFLDTSVWIAGTLSDRGASAAILDLGRKKEFPIVSSPDVFEEARRNLQNKYPLSLPYFLDLFATVHPKLVQPQKKAILKAAKLINPDDAPILAAAKVAKSEFLITLDRQHFIASGLSKKVGLNILLPSEFLNYYRKQQ